MDIFLSQVFERLFKKADIDAESINKAITETLQGNSTALGHKLFKKRVASRHKGKRGGYRTILYYRQREMMIFIYLFAKNEQDNITPKEMKELVQTARLYDTLQGDAVTRAQHAGRLARWHYEEIR